MPQYLVPTGALWRWRGGGGGAKLPGSPAFYLQSGFLDKTWSYWAEQGTCRAGGNKKAAIDCSITWIMTPNSSRVSTQSCLRAPRSRDSLVQELEHPEKRGSSYPTAAIMIWSSQVTRQKVILKIEPQLSPAFLKAVSSWSHLLPNIVWKGCHLTSKTSTPINNHLHQWSGSNRAVQTVLIRLVLEVAFLEKAVPWRQPLLVLTIIKLQISNAQSRQNGSSIPSSWTTLPQINAPPALWCLLVPAQKPHSLEGDHALQVAHGSPNWCLLS